MRTATRTRHYAISIRISRMRTIATTTDSRVELTV
jgi:hypothetical protein